MANSTRMRRIALAVFCTFAIPVPVLGEELAEDAAPLRVSADVLAARPLGLVYLGVGAGPFVGTLAFPPPGSSVVDAADELVVAPGNDALVQCVGCTDEGRGSAGER